MAEFLEVVESIRAEQASPQALFGGEGRRTPSRRGTAHPKYMADLAEAVTFVADVYSGRRRVHEFQEAMTTSDFPILFGDIIDRQVLAHYREWTSTWQSIAKRRTLRDFRPTKLFKPNIGGTGRLGEVGELEEYPEASVTEQTTQLLTVTKFGRRMEFSWETLINDDLDQLRDTPERFGQAARRTEDYAVSELYVGAAGPNAALYTVGNKNIVNITNGAAVTNPPLTIAGLQDAMTVLMNQVDEDGEPILVEAVELVVPPALAIVAENILNAIQLEVNAPGAGGNLTGLANSSGYEQRLITRNWFANRVRLNVNPYINLLATSNQKTSWWLFANPSSNREALTAMFLRGHEEPEIFMKEPNARRVGGGSVDPMNGDFDTDAITYKVRHVFGTATIDGKATVASNGTGA